MWFQIHHLSRELLCLVAKNDAGENYSFSLEEACDPMLDSETLPLMLCTVLLVAVKKQHVVCNCNLDMDNNTILLLHFLTLASQALSRDTAGKVWICLFLGQK